MASCAITGDGVSSMSIVQRTAGSVSLSVAMSPTATPSVRILSCTHPTAGVYHATNGTNVCDATPTITMTSPSPFELDLDSQRQFLSFPHQTGFTVSFSSTSEGTKTVTMTSIGNRSSGGFLAGSLSSPNSNFTVSVRPLQFDLSLRGLAVTNGQTIVQDVDVDSTATLPLAARLQSINTPGAFRWRVKGSYKDDEYPGTCSIGSPSCTFATLSTGGNLQVEWRLDSSAQWRTGPAVVVKGLYPQPGRDRVHTYIAANCPNPWFVKWLPGAEDVLERRWSQYNSAGFPKWGDPHGYGIYQIDPPNRSSAAPQPPLTVLFNWFFNVDRGCDKVQISGVGANQFTADQFTQWRRYNDDHPGQEVPAPADIVLGVCRFSEPATNADEANRLYPIGNVNWIKAYNGAKPYYLVWNENSHQWVLNPLNQRGFTYVERLCTNLQ